MYRLYIIAVDTLDIIRTYFNSVGQAYYPHYC